MWRRLGSAEQGHAARLHVDGFLASGIDAEVDVKRVSEGPHEG
ncbi:hypothetical protein [Micromonospora fulviviridis]|uniref:Uncharacterized protein n=1 Tax=Micromonospora fulviviridis TaxID=47860 RepID=A0ABV2VS28_9ACTN